MRRLNVAIAVVVLLAAVTTAQSPQQGTLTGSVVDQSGSAMPGVLITLTGKRTVTTDKDGQFRFPVLPLGTAELRATLRGFQTAVWKVTIIEKTEPLKIQMRPSKQFPIVFVGDTPNDLRRRREAK